MSEYGGAIVDCGGVDVAGTLARCVSESKVLGLGIMSRRARSVLGEQLVGGEALL